MDKEYRIAKDEKVLRSFISLYCRKHHLDHGAVGHRQEQVQEQGQGHVQEQGKTYCQECYALLHYALQRNANCPLDPKPACRKCEIHCYTAQMREKIRQVMKFSGKYYAKRGRIDWLWHYFF